MAAVDVVTGLIRSHLSCLRTSHWIDGGFMIPLSHSDPPNLHAGLGLDDSARRLLWAGTIAVLRRRGVEPQGQISHGATSVVVTCAERTTGRRVIAKVCYNPENSQARELFHRERQILGSEHDLADILPHYYGGDDEAESGDPECKPCQPFLLLEFLPGRPICDYIAEAREFPLEQRVRLCAKVVRAVQRLHESNLVHGDLSCNNILVSRGDRVRLIDLGQGGRLTRGYRSSHSVAGQAGTEGFSPATLLARQERPSQATDIRQCAAVVFQALTGELAGSEPEAVGAPRQSQILARKRIPADLCRLILRGLRDRNSCLSEDSADPRLYGCAGEFAASLEEWCATQERGRSRLRWMGRSLLGLIPLVGVAGFVQSHLQTKHQIEIGQQVEALTTECAELPYRDHPVIAQLLRQIAEMEQAELKFRRAGDRERALCCLQSRLQYLQQVQSKSAELTWMAPLHEDLDVILAMTPWIESAPGITESLQQLRAMNEALETFLANGQTSVAFVKLLEVQRRLAMATRRNTEALLGAHRPLVAELPGRSLGEEITGVSADCLTSGDLHSRETGHRKHRHRSIARQSTEPVESELVFTAGKQIRSLLPTGERQRLEEVIGRATQKRTHWKTTLLDRLEESSNSRPLREIPVVQQVGGGPVTFADFVSDGVHCKIADSKIRGGRGNDVETVALRVGHHPGEQLVIPWRGIEYRFRWCPPGDFRMGSPTSEMGRRLDEEQVEVAMTKGFWMLETEVTQPMWRTVMGEKWDLGWDEKHGLGESFPAYGVGWSDAHQFCVAMTGQLRFAGGLTGDWRIRLPTEAEWEYSCRAGTTGADCSGSDAAELQRFAWHAWNSGGTNQPVRTRKPNSWGLFDLHGSVWEWTDSDYEAQLLGGLNPPGDSVGMNPVIRGGSVSAGYDSCRSAHRETFAPEMRDVVGFRLCLVSTSSAPAEQKLAARSSE